MSIKGTIKRLENVVAKNNGRHAFTFVIPYCRDNSQTNKIQKEAIRRAGLEDSQEAQYVFVVDYASVI